jgi:hypothetical protein
VFGDHDVQHRVQHERRERIDFAVKPHTPGATRVAKCVELSQRLGGVAMNQVDGVRIALEHNVGGLSAESAAMIAEGPANGS